MAGRGALVFPEADELGMTGSLEVVLQQVWKDGPLSFLLTAALACTSG